MVYEQDRGNHHQLPRFCTAGAAPGVARASKKSKPKKAPQRGLGVAQLERILIEEQKNMEEGPTTAMPVTTRTAHLGPLLPMHPPPPPPPPLSLSALPRDAGVHCGYDPPVLWDPAAADPLKHPYKKRSLCPQPPPLPTCHGQVSTALSLTVSTSTHPTEPPSMYSSRSSAPPPADEDDREAAGVDRFCPFVFEGPNPATYRTTAAGKASFVARTRRTREAAGFPGVCPDPDLSRYELRAANYFSSSASYSEWSSELARHIKSSKGNEHEPACCYLTLNAQPPPAPRVKQPAALPPNHRPELRDFGGVTQPQHGSASASSSRPFYNFMPLPVGPVRCERPLSEIKADVSDGVDLELKL
uniref:Uncharacterized protein n=1 Tax=Zea mays TaxID=4577 RepID=A0A804QJ69_MAIZE